MKITAKHHYAQDVATVFAHFTDPDETRSKQEALGARKIRVDKCEVGADRATVNFSRELPANVPGILQRFLQPWNRVKQSESWRATADGFTADLAIDIAGVPVDVSGTLRLKATADGCVNHVYIDVNCSIPFVGKTLAEFVAADCTRLVAEEYDYLLDRLEA